MSKRSKRRGKFKFELHSNYKVGPNRTTFDSAKAISFFKKIRNRGQFQSTMGAKITHINSGLYLEAFNLTELEEIVARVVDPINAKR